MLLYGFIICLALAFGLSWWSFFQAANNASQVYLPLENYFFSNTVNETSVLYNKPGFYLSDFDFHPALEVSIFNEVFMWIFCFASVLIFLKISSCHEWFHVKKTQSQKNTIPIFLGKPLKSLSIRLQSTDNIFNLDFKQISFIAFCFATVFVFLIPNDSSDIYGYMARGAQQSYFGLNPYHSTIFQIDGWQDHALLSNINPIWAHNPAPYGPFFMMLYWAISLISMGNFYVALFLFKALNLGVFAALLLALATILNDESLNKEFFEKKFKDARQIFSYKKIIYSLVALNPFVMVQILWNGHNDLFMGFTIMLALYLVFKNKFNLGLIILSLSILSKYLSLILVPFVLIYIFSKGIKHFPWLGSIISTGMFYMAWYFYQPFDINSKAISKNILLCHKSLQKTIVSLVKAVTHEDISQGLNVFFLGLFAMSLIFLYYKFVKAQNKRLALFHFSFLAMFLLIFVFSAKFHSWYLLMILPLGIIIHPRLMLILSLSHMLSLTFLDQANIANFIVMTAIPSGIYFRYLLKQDL